MAETIAVLSQKGGTGKTTTVRTLTDVLRRVDLRVLAIDLDPQGDLSDYFDIDPEASPTVGDVLAGRAKAKAAIHDDVIPANLSLAEAELALAGKMGRELTLKRALKDVKRDYDVILLDCSPSLGVLTLNALTAAHALIIPMPCEMLSHRGVGQLLDTVRDVKRILNKKLRVLGILPTLYDGRSLHAREVLEDVGSRYDLPVLMPPIPKTVRFAEAPAVGRSILSTARSSKGATAYREVAATVLAQLATT